MSSEDRDKYFDSAEDFAERGWRPVQCNESTRYWLPHHLFAEESSISNHVLDERRYVVRGESATALAGTLQVGWYRLQQRQHLAVQFCCQSSLYQFM